MTRVLLRMLLVLFAGWVVCMPARTEASVPPRTVIPFHGTLDLKAGRIEVTLGSGTAGCVVLEVARPAGGRYDLKADIRHVDTWLGDVAAVMTGRFELLGRDPLRRELLGEVATRYTLLNYKPVRDVYIKFAVRNRRLTVDPLWLGALSGRGEIGLMSPYDMDVSLDLLSADLDEWWAMLNGRGMKTPPVSGILTGSLTLKGPWAKPLLAGHFAAYKGQLKDFGYDSLDMRFEGTYPLVSLQDARVVSSDGPSFKVAGSLDLGDLARLGTQIRQLKREFIVSDDSGGRARSFRLNAVDGHSTRLKSFVSGDVDGRDQGKSVIGLEKHIGF